MSSSPFLAMTQLATATDLLNEEVRTYLTPSQEVYQHDDSTPDTPSSSARGTARSWWWTLASPLSCSLTISSPTWPTAPPFKTAPAGADVAVRPMAAIVTSDGPRARAQGPSA